jgi:hypothetical protein
MTEDLLVNSVKFIGEHFLDITLFILILILFIAFMGLEHIKIRKTKPVLQKVVVIEKMKTLKDNKINFLTDENYYLGENKN